MERRQLPEKPLAVEMLAPGKKSKGGMQAWKPPRAHHDSVSGRCVLKMDHYCVWIINCVGLLNYKAFLLFMVYACLACGLACVLLLSVCITFLTDSHSQKTPSTLVFIAFVVDLAFVLCLVGFLVMHGRLVAANCTTIEMYEKRRVPHWPYDRGIKNNFLEVFGNRWIRWIVPTLTESERTELLDSMLNRRQAGIESLKLTELASEL